MSKKTTLFDNDKNSGPKTPKEAKFLDRLKDLDDKIAAAINRVKTLKAEKTKLEERVKELENAIADRDAQLEMLSSEKTDVRGQIESLLDELEAIQED